ncbi:hypothetical protein ECZC10_46180 [Escherichia coli]|nr:hypothetical protein ECZC10_46180 [Escherichia coli]
MRNPLKPLIISRISITLIITSIISENRGIGFLYLLITLILTFTAARAIYKYNDNWMYIIRFLLLL